jgi:sugar lactone lactonase YvrE
MRSVVIISLSALAASGALAVETQKFVKDTYDDFARGEARGVSITEKGELRLAPAVKKLCDVALPIVWSAARDFKGNVYLGGGEGKVLRVGSDGKTATFFTAKEIEIRALAVDAKDNVYAASSPDGKVYRVAPDGKSSVFYDPPDKYIWALAFDGAGNLFVACGSKAAIYKVSPTGIAEKYFASDETNIISLGFDKKGRLLAGSHPGAYLYRFDGPDKGFVVHAASAKEIKAIVGDGQGGVYTLAIGDAEPPPAVTVTLVGGATVKPEEKKATRKSDLYRVHPDGYAELLWTGRDITGFSLAATPDGAALVGTGDKGVIYSVRDRQEVATVARLEGQQVTSLLLAGQGGWVAVTSNLGAVWSLATNHAAEGSWESEPLDARVFSTWGLAVVKGAIPTGARVSISSRSGNTEKPEKTWSDWSDAGKSGENYELKSPAARYLQLRAKLGGDRVAHGPALDRLTVYYTPRNVRPVFGRLTVHDAGSGLQKITQPDPPAMGTLDMMVASSGRRDPMDAARKQRTQVVNQPGLRTAMWTVGDMNFDPLTFDVYLRAEDETAWKLLAEKSGDLFFTFDTRSFPDGYYRLKVVATDATGNAPGKGLTASIESTAFAVDNTPPVITVHHTEAGKDGVLTAKFTVTDTLTTMSLVEVSTDGRDWFPVQADRAQVGARSQDFTVRLPGTKSAFIRARDEAGNIGAAKAVAK